MTTKLGLRSPVFPQPARPGWVRNTGTSNVDLLEQVNILSKENAALKVEKQTEPLIPEEELASGNDKARVSGRVRVTAPGSVTPKPEDWIAETSWNQLFKVIGPILINEASHDEIKVELKRFLGAWDGYQKSNNYSIISIGKDTYAEIITQFRALGLISKGTKKRAVSDSGSYWALTERGDQYLIGLLAKRKGSAND